MSSAATGHGRCATLIGPVVDFIEKSGVLAGSFACNSNILAKGGIFCSESLVPQGPDEVEFLQPDFLTGLMSVEAGMIRFCTLRCELSRGLGCGPD